MNQMEDLGRGSENISKRRKTSNDEKVRESSSDEKCTKSSSDEKQADIAIEGGNFSMIIFSALQGYTIKGVDRGFEVYRNNLQDTGAEQLEGHEAPRLHRRKLRWHKTSIYKPRIDFQKVRYIF